MRLGQYEFDHQLLININSNDIEEMDYTELHEYVHLILSQKSLYGAFIIFLTYPERIDNRLNWLKEEMVINMRDLQEGIAYYIELLAFWKSKGEKEYKFRLDEFRKGHANFKNIRKLLFIEDIIKKGFLSIEEAVSLIISLGHYALEIDVTQLPKDCFECKKKFKKKFSNGNITKHFSPSQRFKLIMSQYKNFFEEGKSVDLCLLESLNSVKDFNIKLDEAFLKKLSEFTKQLYKPSNRFEEICLKLENIKLDNKPPGYIAVYPTNLDIAKKFNIANCINYPYEDRFKIFERDNLLGIFVVLFSNMLIEDSYPFSYIGVAESVITTYFDKNDIAEMHKKIIASNLPFILLGNKKLIAKYIDELLYRGRNRVYVFIDLAMVYNVDFINEKFTNAYYRVLVYSNFAVLLMNKSNIIMIQIISKNAILEINEMISNAQLKLYDVKLDNNNYDDYVIRNDEDFKDIDIIIDTFLSNNLELH